MAKRYKDGGAGQSLGVETQVRLQLDAEVEAILRHLGVVLPGEWYDKALGILARSDDDEQPS